MILGSVLSVTAPTSAPAPVAKVEHPVVDPMRTVIGSRPKGALSAVAEKVEYYTQEGLKTLYLIVSFMPVATSDGKGTVDRAIEFFMPVGQSGESQQWITSSMRMLSLAARGGFLERALGDMRKVAWDRGPVRLGTHTKPDGTQVPLWHDSEVAAIAYSIQNIITKRARQPVHAVQIEHEDESDEAHEHEGEHDHAHANGNVAKSSGPGVMAGKKCSECGAHATIRKDGCDFCTSCGNVGSCG